MKKLNLLFIASIAWQFIFANTVPVPVKSSITAVTVYLQGARVTRVSNITVNAGITELIFEKLPRTINASSIQVKGLGNFTVLSVVHQVNYMNTKEKSAETLQLEAKKDELTNQLNKLNAKIEVHNQEEQLLQANKSLGGTQNGVSVNELKMASDFFRARLLDIKNTKLETNLAIAKINQELAKIQNQLTRYNQEQNTPTAEIIVKVSSAGYSNGKLELDYSVTNAGWVPTYDARSNGVSGPVNLLFKANVYQSTGEDWKKINLNLSTGNPNLSGVKPNLGTWYLKPYYPQPRNTYGDVYESEMMAPKSRARMDKSEMLMESLDESPSIADMTTVKVGQVTTEYQIDVPYDVPANGKQYTVEIQKHELPANYLYYAVPKLDKDAFLVARVTGWEKYNLLPGSMNLFFEGAYVGESYLDPGITSDTLDLSLGRDRNITIERDKMKDFSSEKVIGSTRKKEIGWEISVKNNKRQSITLILEDQVPVSTNKDIEVSIDEDELDDAIFKSNTGELKWKINLDAGSNIKKSFRYEVKYPREMNLVLE